MTAATALQRLTTPYNALQRLTTPDISLNISLNLKNVAQSTMLEASEDPALLPRFDISHDFGLSVVSASEDIALTRTSEFEPFDLTRAEVPPARCDRRT
ncbi:hypothetical protein DPMN_157206 [Dreissena polymorpha]|uniref:Uncharacterized protein n=1 Tax=Dreissena polymorpha TaxID=45954 RepID=A0A9D4IPS7_DREPO|nr:hypothetical protein DPMN_157206 [Dreissena polymorpha]